MKTRKDTPKDFYLDYVNNWLTIENMSAHYNMSEEDTLARRIEGKKEHEGRIRLTELRKELRSESISYSELVELQILDNQLVHLFEFVNPMYRDEF